MLKSFLVDNNSDDGSKEHLRNYCPEMRLIFLDHNSGFSGGNNIGIRAAKGEYIVLLNNVTVVEPDWLEKPYEGMVSDPTVGICASKMVSYFDTAGGGVSISGAAFKRGHMENKDKWSILEKKWLTTRLKGKNKHGPCHYHSKL